jgi:tetraacyldisaccharide 4'-kinase
MHDGDHAGTDVQGNGAMTIPLHTDRRKVAVPWWEQILRGHRNDLIAQSIRRFARLGSWGYGAGVKGRQLAYEHGWLSVKRLPLPTICVGNITVGGTGKTPLVIRLASDLLAQGLRPAVLLRGYKREKTKHAAVLVRDANGIRATVAESGDEAMELAVRLPGACVGVGADRYAVGNFILKNHSVDCFILDDGFQHHRLERDINIVTVDVTDPWGGGQLLPAGLLREPPDALCRADAVVLTRTGSVGPDRLSFLRAEVSMHMRPSSGLLESRHEPRQLVSLQGRKNLPLSDLKGKKVLVVSAIGNPKSFENAVTQLGAHLAATMRLADHTGSADQVREWIQRNRRRAEWVLMTEKDAMRWGLDEGLFADSGLPADMQAYALRMQLVFSDGEDHWRKLIALIKRLAHAG